MTKTLEITGDLQLSPIKLKAEYIKEWNISSKDFKILSKGDNPIRNTLYRIGGLGGFNKDGYSLIIKNVEEIYDGSEYGGTKNQKHLKSFWVIIDKHGDEKVSFEDKFHTAYLVRNSILYSIDHKYYNIETGEFICQSSKSMETKEFIYLHNEYPSIYDKDRLDRKGVIKVDKKTGEYTITK